MKKKITIRDLAKEAGVSVTTVSQILNNKGDRFSTATQERVLALRDKYKYVPDFNARNLILKSAKTIGVLVPNIANPFFGTFVEECRVLPVKQNLFHLSLVPTVTQNWKNITFPR